MSRPLRYGKIEIFLYLFQPYIRYRIKKKMQIKLAKLYQCAHLKVIPMHLHAGRTLWRCWIYTSRLLAHVPVVDSYPPISANWSAGLRLIRCALCVLDFYSWKHFKFRWQNWLGILFAIETISMRPFDNRANLPLPFLRHQKSVSFSPFSFSSSISFFVQIGYLLIFAARARQAHT